MTQILVCLFTQYFVQMQIPCVMSMGLVYAGVLRFYAYAPFHFWAMCLHEVKILLTPLTYISRYVAMIRLFSR